MTRRLILFLLLAGLAAGTSGPSKQNDDDDHLWFSVSNLIGWTQVNRQPYYISSKIDVLCVAPPKPADYERERKQNPHASTYVTVFVNEVGRSAMFANPSQVFPEGSIILKRKFDAALQSGTPILSTVMIKREAGYNPAAGDWEFAVVSGDGKTIEAKGKLANCMSCHTSRRDTDFVFRSYPPGHLQFDNNF